MEIIRLLKNIWEQAVVNGYENAMRSLEMTIQEQLSENYNISLVEFDRINKQIKFQFELEEIEL
jgi:hypothetical protein